MRSLISLILVFVFAAPALAQDVISETEFRDAVIEDIRKDVPDLCVQIIDDWSFSVGETEDDCDSTLFIGNAYNNYLDDTENLSVYVGEMAGVATFSFNRKDATNDSPDQIVALLRPSDYYDYMMTITDERNKFPIYRPFAGDIYLMLMLDFPTAVSTTNQGTLADLQITEDQAWALSELNTRSRMGELTREDYGDLEYVTSSTGLAAGLLALPESCGLGRDDFDAAIVDRNDIVITKPGNEMGRDILKDFMRDLIRDGENYTDNILQCRDGKWSALYLDRSGQWQPYTATE